MKYLESDGRPATYTRDKLTAVFTSMGVQNNDAQRSHVNSCLIDPTKPTCLTCFSTEDKEGRDTPGACTAYWTRTLKMMENFATFDSVATEETRCDQCGLDFHLRSRHEAIEQECRVSYRLALRKVRYQLPAIGFVFRSETK